MDVMGQNECNESWPLLLNGQVALQNIVDYYSIHYAPDRDIKEKTYRSWLLAYQYVKEI